MRVLVVEDEKRLAAGLRNGLEAEGFAVDVVNNGTDGLWMAREHPFDAIVLDILLPGVNGYRVCATLREQGNWTPILMLTAKDGEWDEVEESRPSTPGPTTTSPSRSPPPCWWPGCGPFCAAAPAPDRPC